MKCKILHESSGRLRLKAQQRRMTLAEADQLEAYLQTLPGVRQAVVHERTCSMILFYSGDRQQLLRGVTAFSYDREALAAPEPEHSGRALNRMY